MQLGIKGVQYLQVAEPKPVVGFSLAYRRNTHAQAAINFSSLIQSLLKND